MCLTVGDTGGGGDWRLLECTGDVKQTGFQFRGSENVLRYKETNECMDVGGKSGHWGCDLHGANQTMIRLPELL